MPKKIVQMLLRLNEKTKQKAKKLAIKSELTLTAWIRLLIKKEIDRSK